MKRALVSVILIHLIPCIQAQQNLYLEHNDTIFFNDTIPEGLMIETETIPEFPGGEDALVSFIKLHIQYPKSAIKDSIEGKVSFTFSIDEKGIIGDINFLSLIHPEIETQCRQMLLEMPRWKPATQLTNSKKGWYWRPIKIWYYLGLNFALTNNTKLNGIVITP